LTARETVLINLLRIYSDAEMAAKLQFHEGKACDAVIRRIEEREGGKRQNLRLPERERHLAPIELACEIAGRLFALEHTGIEPFAGHMRLEADPPCQ
jgi:hypothetical protein